jgi:hypothetical protein
LFPWKSLKNGEPVKKNSDLTWLLRSWNIWKQTPQEEKKKGKMEIDKNTND